RPNAAQAGGARLTDTRHPARRPVHRPAGPARSARGPPRGRGGGAAHALTRGADTADAVYRQADAAARARHAQSHPRGVGAWAGRDPAAPAVAPAGPAHTGMRAHPRVRAPTHRRGPRERPWSQTDAGVASPRPRPSATESAHTGRPALVRSRRSDPTARARAPRRPPDTWPAGSRCGLDTRGSAGPPAAVRTGSAATVTPLASTLAVQLWHVSPTLRLGGTPRSPCAPPAWCHPHVWCHASHGS